MLLMFAAFPAQAEKVQEVVSKSGVKAWLVEEHSVPLIAVKVTFTEAGIAAAPDDKISLPAMVTNLLDQGAGEKDAAQFQAALEDHAIRMGSTVDEDFLSVSMETLSEHRAMAFALLKEALARPRFDADALTRVKGQMQAALTRSLDKPEYLAQQELQRVLYGNHPYARMRLGSKESIEAVTGDDLHHFTQAYFTRGNMIIGVVGDITQAELAVLLEESFAQLPAAFTPSHTTEDITAFPASVTRRVEKDVPQTVVLFALPGLKRTDPQYLAAYVMNEILGSSGLNSVLSKELREKHGLTYSVNSSLDPSLHAASLSGSFSTQQEKVGEAVKVMQDTLARFRKDGVNGKQLAAAKDYITGTFPLQLDNNAAIANFLVSMQIYHLGIDYLEKRNDLMRVVTLSEVNAIIKQLIDTEKLAIVMAGKPQP